MIDNPITRKEKYLAKLTGSYTGNVPDPITRVEKYLYDLCQKGISGLTPEEIENAVSKYLEGKDYVTKTDADKLYQPAGSYLSGTDEDLAVSGKAADAKAVGNAVAKIEGINYTNRGTLADTDAFPINDGTGMKKSVLSKLSDFVLNKIADKVFAKLQTNDKTILGAINELNSNRLTDSTKLLETPTEYIKNISDSDYTSCFRNGKIVTLVLNIKTLKPLSAFNIYLTLPEQYVPSSVIFAPAIGLNAGIRIGPRGEVMPCVNVDAGKNLQTVVSYVIK
jgi:hypothetical protein|nr:MAG TPA: hypothetical protein [Caudoviricetes sp.]